MREVVVLSFHHALLNLSALTTYDTDIPGVCSVQEGFVLFSHVGNMLCTSSAE